jgi:hypothetical protein
VTAAVPSPEVDDALNRAAMRRRATSAETSPLVRQSPGTATECPRNPRPATVTELVALEVSPSASVMVARTDRADRGVGMRGARGLARHHRARAVPEIDRHFLYWTGGGIRRC